MKHIETSSGEKETRRSVWLASYPPGVPATIDADKYRSLVDMFEQSVAAFGEKIAFVHMDKAMTFEELDRLSLAFAAYLQKELRLDKGARVALMMPNMLQYPIALFGALRGGYTVVNCNPLYTPRELGHQLKDSGAEAIVILENFAAVLQQIIDKTEVKHVIVTRTG